MSLFTRRRSAQKTIIPTASSAAIPSRSRVGRADGQSGHLRGRVKNFVCSAAL